MPLLRRKNERVAKRCWRATANYFLCCFRPFYTLLNLCVMSLKLQTSSRTIGRSKAEKAAEKTGSHKPGVLLHTP